MITIKYNIDFSKALKELEEKRLTKTLNKGLSPALAKDSKQYIKGSNAMEKLSPTQLNVRRHTYKVDRKNPLWMTGKLVKSLKGSSEGLKGVPYAKQHLEGYTWSWDHRDKVADSPEVPARNFLEGFKKDKNIEDFKKDFIKLLNKRIRKR